VSAGNGNLTIHADISAFDASKPVSLTLTYENEDKPIKDAVFNLSAGADTADGLDYTLSEDFADASIDISGDAEDWNWTGLASTFESYILVEDAEKEEINPVAEGKTQDNGNLTFSNLKAGLYLLTGDTLKKDGIEYIPGAALISLPYMQDDGTIDYHPDIEPKYTIKTYSTPSTSDDLTNLHAQKIWSDNNSSKRPSAIKVMLFKDGEEYDEVELNEKNSWYYSWKNMDSTARWQLGEVSVPDGYTVVSESTGSTFVVTNTLTTTTKTSTGTPKSGTPRKPGTPSVLNPQTPNDSIPNPDNPDKVTPNTPNDTTPDTPSDTIEVTSETPSIDTDNPPVVTDISPNIPQNNPDNPNNPTTTLPQTGQLWWPVPLLAFGGLILVAVGMYLRKGKPDEE
jgi:hypothetical protein